ncbi:hypothetical protein ACHAXS_002789, partial [Conticribra weissflogii]
AQTAGGGHRRSRGRGGVGAAFDDDDDDDEFDYDGAGTGGRPRRSDSRPRRSSRRLLPTSPLQRRLAHWKVQCQRIASLLLGQIPEADALALQAHRGRQADDRDRDRPPDFKRDPILNSHGETEEEILLHLLSAKSTARVLRLFLLVPLLYYVCRAAVPPTVDRLTRPKPWSWSVSRDGGSSAVARHRNLAGRSCVMNYFIEKQPPDEYDPDYVESKPKDGDDKDGKKSDKSDGKIDHHGNKAAVTIVEGTYRTKGQVHVISRFIEAIADSFRSNTKIRQHLIFAESRDGGHLAHEAIRHWPPRGKFKTMVHVLASEDLPFFGAGDEDAENRAVARALGYGSLEDVELRFRGNDKARVYDRDGNMAGLPAAEGADDDETDGLDEIDVPDRETLEFRIRSGKRRRRNNALGDGDANSTETSYGYVLPPGIKPYPDLRALLPFEDEDDGEGDIVVPYLHVDGISMGHQMAVLESARSLLEDQTIVVVGLEHSRDLDVRVLIEFFRRVGYKTFFLGARQIARIDNLCEEVLDDVLEHPSVSAPKAGLWRRLFMKLGLISKDELRIVVADPKQRKREIARELKLELASRMNDNGDIQGGGGAFGPKRRETPPFFVAMPRGRRSKEEMTIQHMYDLFGGYGGGGGQIKTANDRKRLPGSRQVIVVVVALWWQGHWTWIRIDR